jgi:hypothetical protein
VAAADRHDSVGGLEITLLSPLVSARGRDPPRDPLSRPLMVAIHPSYLASESLRPKCLAALALLQEFSFHLRVGLHLPAPTFLMLASPTHQSKPNRWIPWIPSYRVKAGKVCVCV